VNKLRGNKLVKHKWGNAVIWAHTDSYIAKTLEIPVNKRTSLVVHEQKEKSIIVIKGEVLLLMEVVVQKQMFLFINFLQDGLGIYNQV
jgi:hypothetical protein